MNSNTAALAPDQLRDLVDHHELSQLVHRVGACLDDGRFEDLRTIYTDDATASTPGGAVEGIDALVAQASRNHTPDDQIQHVISDILIDRDGGDASIRANLIVTFAGHDLDVEPRLTLGERYRFRARRTDSGWRLTRVESRPVWAVRRPT